MPIKFIIVIVVDVMVDFMCQVGLVPIPKQVVKRYSGYTSEDVSMSVFLNISLWTWPRSSQLLVVGPRLLQLRHRPL